MRAVILAGGEGTRLRPYTTVLPKPLMPVGNFPIAETIVNQLKYFGFDQITFAVGYLHQLIEAYFSDGRKWGVSISYLHEEQPRGTVGPLSQVPDFNEPLLVLNGDILTDLNFAAFYQYHLDYASEITIAAYDKDVKIDLGVIESSDSGMVTNYIEKPQYSYQVSMGIYVFSPSVLQLIPTDGRLDFPDLVKMLLENKQPVRTYSYEGIWLDIGRSEDHQQATDMFNRYRIRLLPESATCKTERKINI